MGRSPGQQRKKMETENAIRRKPALTPKPRKKTQKYSGQGEELVR